MKTLIFILVMAFTMPCYAGESETHSTYAETVWNTVRGKNELCPSTFKVGVYKRFKDTSLGCDVEIGANYKGWVRNVTQENEVEVLDVRFIY